MFRDEKEKWIRAKYEQKEFIPPPPYLDVPLSQVSRSATSRQPSRRFCVFCEGLEALCRCATQTLQWDL